MTMWDWLATTTPLGWATAGVVILGAVLTIGVLVLLFVAQRSPTSPFDAAQMLQDDKGRTSGPKLGYVIFLGVSAWVTLWLTVQNKLTPEYLAIVLGAFIFGKLGSQWLDKSPGAPEPPTLTDVVHAPDPRKG